MKTRMQLDRELYEIIAGKNVAILLEIARKTFPKHRGGISDLSNDQLEKILPEVKKAYGKTE